MQSRSFYLQRNFMDHVDTAQTFIHMLSEGGFPAIIAILVVIIIAIVWERIDLIKQLNKTTELVYAAKDNETNSIKEIIDKYHQGNLNLIYYICTFKTGCHMTATV